MGVDVGVGVFVGPPGVLVGGGGVDVGVGVFVGPPGVLVGQPGPGQSLQHHR